MSTVHTLQAIEQFWQHVTNPVPATLPQDRAEVNAGNLRAVLVERDLRAVLVPFASQRSAAAPAHGQGG